MHHDISSHPLLVSKEFHDELTGNILPFWIDRMTDQEYGGFYGCIDGHNQLHAKADKGVILNTRILWTFSAAYAYTPNTQYLEVAQRAYHYIKSYFLDPVHGGVYWALDHQGTPVDTKKQLYAQAFALYAFSEYYKITQQQEVLNTCIEFFNHIETFSFDRQYNGYFEALDREWNILPDVRLSDKDANEVKTMNTHLHILEAYTNLFRIWPEQTLKGQLKNLTQLFFEKFISPTYHFNLFFDEQWQLKSDATSYGHDIEGSWLLHEAVKVLDESTLLDKVEDIAIKMVEASLAGIDDDGALINETTKTIIDSDKHWWVQAEALVGLVNAWQITGDDKYLEYTRKTWAFIQKHIIDRENGEWLWRVTKTHDRVTKEDKAGPWKCPYHNGRAMMELIKRLSKQIL